VSLEFVIGGREGIGKGWRMLMESLAAGRWISSPAMSVAAAQLSTRVVGAYATIREQFDTPIGRFEGVEEPLTRIAGHTYWISAAPRLSCSALEAGERPSVVSAITKAYLTEGMRTVLTDAMDIRAGSAIMRGPRNVLSRNYQAAPIARSILEDRVARRTLTREIYMPGKDEVGLGRLKAALEKSTDAQRVESELRDAVRNGVLDRAPGDQLAESALQAGLIGHHELQVLKDAGDIRDEVIQVDAFEPDEYAQMR